MNKPLLDVIFASEKRRSVLLLLKDGPRDMEEILCHIHTTRQVLLPQMRILEKHHLIIHQKDACELTTIGKLIVDEMIPLLDDISFFNGEDQYWGTHKLDFLPPHLLKRISELGEHAIIKPPITKSFELNQKIIEAGYISESHHAACAYYHADMSSVLSRMVKNGVTIHYLVTSSVLEKMIDGDREELTQLLENKLFHMYVCPGMDFLGFTYNDHSVLLRLLKNDGSADSTQVECFDPRSHEWAEELFEYLLKDAVPVKKWPEYLLKYKIPAMK